MVVGAYTIINTIGLLVGLPFHSNSTSRFNSIQINNSFYDYYLQHDYLETDFYYILDCKNTSYVFGSTDSATLLYYDSGEDSPYISFDSEFLSSINGPSNNVYYIFHCTSLTYESTPYQTNVINISRKQTSSNTWDINQVYFGVLTSKYTNLNSDTIINSITSGLGLMGDITTNFKNGFSALIWDSTDNKLTTFGNFALIFLGVSITFAIVKLCLNLIRSKTGA